MPAAIAWLTTNFGFTEHYRYGQSGGPDEGAQMRLGDAYIILNSAKAAGAKIVEGFA